MRKLLAALFVSFMLTACSPGGLTSTPTPDQVADRTVLDERAALSVELAYNAAGRALELAVDAGVVRGQAAVTAAAAERRAWAAVQAVRAAYGTGNASSYAIAIDEARAAVAAVLVAIKGN